MEHSQRSTNRLSTLSSNDAASRNRTRRLTLHLRNLITYLERPKPPGRQIALRCAPSKDTNFLIYVQCTVQYEQGYCLCPKT